MKVLNCFLDYFYRYSAPGIKTKSHLCPAHYFSHEIAESGKVWQQKKTFFWIGTVLFFGVGTTQVFLGWGAVG
jgi:hypothetical protein